MKLSMQQRIVMNMAAAPSGMSRWDVDGRGFRTIGSLRKRGLVELDGRVYRLTEAGKEARKAWAS